MKAKPAEAGESRRLRKRGFSIKEIARTLGVSKSSVSSWVKEIVLTDEQREKLDARMSFAAANRKRMFDAAEKRAAQQERGRAQARTDDPRFIAGCMLYWAEGSKKRNDVVFVNSDPEMMAFFVEFLRDYYGVKNAEISLSVTAHVTSELSLEQTESFWLDCLALDSACLRKSTIRQGYSDGKLKYGIARLVVHRTDIVQEIYGAIQEFGGFERPTWIQ